MEEYGFNLIKDRITFVEGNRGVYDYVDFQLMTICKHIIVAPKSSFSSTACKLNKTENPRIDWENIGMDYNETFGFKRNNDEKEIHK